MKRICFGFLLVLSVGCAHSIHEVHTSDFLPSSEMSHGQMIKATSEQFVVLGITGDTNYVNEAYDKLKSACPTGAVTGITTQLSTSLGFFSWTNKVLMQGLCVQPQAQPTNPPQKRT